MFQKVKDLQHKVLTKETARVTCLRRVIVPLLVVLLPSLVVYGAGWAGKKQVKRNREDFPQLAVGSSDVIKTYRGKPVLCEKYVVNRGDSVWKILRQRIDGTLGQMKHWSNVMQEFNPEIVDPNIIYPGQHLLVPLGFLSQARAETVLPPGEGKTRIYVVEPGDTLSTILRYRFNIPFRLVFNEAINEVKSLNPHVKDFDAITPGQRIVIPLSLSTGSADLAGTRVPGETGTSAAAQLQAPAPPATNELSDGQEFEPSPRSNEPTTTVQASNQRPVSSAVAEESIAASPVVANPSHPGPGEKRLQVLGESVGATVIGLGGKADNKGSYFLPLPNQGQISFKLEHFPLLEFPSGERIFLDLGDRLPSSLEEAIRANYKGLYEVVKVKESDNFASIWQRVIAQLTQMNLWNDSDPFLVHNPLEIFVRGDWVLTYGQRPQVFVINLLRSPEERTDPALQAYLSDEGIRVVDVQLREEQQLPFVSAPLNRRAFNKIRKPVVCRSSSPPDLVEAFLEVLGQEYKRDASVPLDSGANRGITLSVMAGFYFQRDGDYHLIDFHRLSPSIISLLKEWHLRVLVIDPRSTTDQVFKAMIEHLKLNVSNSYTFSVSAREPERNILVRCPGNLVTDGSQSYLLTPVSFPHSLTEFLYRNGVRVLSY
jgi:LysM repeat protein